MTTLEKVKRCSKSTLWLSGTLTCGLLILLDVVFCGHGIIPKEGTIKISGICDIPAGRWVLWALSLWCLSMLIIDAIKRYNKKRGYQGECAKRRILGLSKDAQGLIRANFECDFPIELDKKSPILAELRRGKFVTILPCAINDFMVTCKLNPWVTECLKCYQDLVPQLKELEDWERNFL